jgi:transposase
VAAGIDVGKHELRVVLRWGEDGWFERPWQVHNPSEVRLLVHHLCELQAGCELRVGMEPSGTYGDALRQALADAGIMVHRVSPKASSDYAEVFDGVPSQHDGKDAAVVAELVAMGKSRPWSYQPASEADRQMAYWVEWLAVQHRMWSMWSGRLEGLLARHWPEATRVLRLSRGTLLRALEEYGGPAWLAADQDAVERLCAWGGGKLTRAKAEQLVHEARETVGVRQCAMDRQQIQEWARQALAARREVRRSKRDLERLGASNQVIQRQGKVVGMSTACVLWVYLGNPQDYDSGPAYRKAMGLNLAERSSGIYQGRLKISKRGHGAPRRWLFLSALRQIRKPEVRDWYESKKKRDKGRSRGAIVGVMRRLALALWSVGMGTMEYDASQLFPGFQERLRRRRRRRSGRVSQVMSEV